MLSEFLDLALLLTVQTPQTVQTLFQLSDLTVAPFLFLHEELDLLLNLSVLFECLPQQNLFICEGFLQIARFDLQALVQAFDRH
jgi:hypothetical protein